MSRYVNKKIEKAFHKLSKEVQDLYLSRTVPVLQASISPVAFYRNFVSKNIPVVIKNGIKHWKAVEKWNIEYLRSVMGNESISVAVTPNGYADAVANEITSPGTTGQEEFFVMPEERFMTMNAFLENLEAPNENHVCYIQKQNNNFHEYPELKKDIDSDISWATESFGTKPDVVNFWMGDQRAVTSMHRDPYENIYCVVSGTKEFILHPPTDLPWIPFSRYRRAIYKEVEPGSWITVPVRDNNVEPEDSYDDEEPEDDDLIPWICVDPLDPDYQMFPKYQFATRIKVQVNKGDILYLPSLWFHHVQQSHACIAINYWYDMAFDIKYAYYKFLESLC